MSQALIIQNRSSFSITADMPKVKVGKKNPIELPLIPIEKIAQTIGEKIGEGQSSAICSVLNTNPQRVYKIIFPDDFTDGNEIRISKIATDAGVAPFFYGACLVEQQDQSQFVLIEMDRAGKSLYRWMEDLAQESDVEKAAAIQISPALVAKEKALQKAREEKESRSTSGYRVVYSSPGPETLSMEQSVDKLYGDRETFFFEMFSKLKMLAEKKIAYMDSNCGNIIPMLQQKSVQLIDFGSALLMSSITEAASEVLNGLHNQTHLKDYSRLPNLSNKSQELIKWFKTQQLENALARFS